LHTLLTSICYSLSKPAWVKVWVGSGSTERIFLIEIQDPESRAYTVFEEESKQTPLEGDVHHGGSFTRVKRPDSDPDVFELWVENLTTNDIRPTLFNRLTPEKQAELMYETCEMGEEMGDEFGAEFVITGVWFYENIPDYEYGPNGAVAGPNRDVGYWEKR
jgi:hypothetical protein